MEDRGTKWIQLFSGEPFWPLDPRVEEIDITDIAHSLSMLCRFNGHCIKFYSVAEHSVLMARNIRERGLSLPTQLWALMHDTPEAYVGDLVRPLKQGDGRRDAIERHLMMKICTRFHMRFVEPGIVREFDTRILGDERHNMKPSVRPWFPTGEPLGIQLQCWTPEEAERQFLRLFSELISDIELLRLSVTPP